MDPSKPKANPARFMILFGAFILLAIIVYYGFMAINTLGLEDHSAFARVVEKEYRKEGKTYTTQVIGGRSLIRSQDTPEMYIVHLDLNGEIISGPVGQKLYKVLRVGDEVEVIYRQRRITGSRHFVEIPSPF